MDQLVFDYSENEVMDLTPSGPLTIIQVEARILPWQLTAVCSNDPGDFHLFQHQKPSCALFRETCIWDSTAHRKIIATGSC
jgi:hypothetical protein